MKMLVKVDRGCKYAPSCLGCPFSECVYGEFRGERSMLKAERDKDIAELSSGGMSAKQIAERFDIHIRTVHRALGGK